MVQIRLVIEMDAASQQEAIDEINEMTQNSVTNKTIQVISTEIRI
jgi:phosphoribosylformylglycinamidine (FGAM) synthase PurS component